MKKLFMMFLCSIFLFGCSSSSNNEKSSTNDKKEVEVVKEKEEEKLSSQELDEKLNTLPLVVESTKYTVQDEEYKSLYPDLMQAILRNNSNSDIKSAIVSFVAWDVNNLPIKIKGSFDVDGTYVKDVNYEDINLVPGATFGDKHGFEVSEECNVQTFKAVVKSYETFEGDKWTNPYYNDWVDLYSGKKLVLVN